MTTCRSCRERPAIRRGLSTRLCGECLDARRPKYVKPERATPAYKLTRAVSRHGATRPNMDIARGLHRSEALRQSARDEACVACGVRDGTVVWCHANEAELGKGKSLKCHDLLGNYLCAVHHFWYDASGASREEKRAFFRECYPKTMVRVAEKLAHGELRL